MTTAPPGRWCRTCGNPVEGTPGQPRCCCWGLLAGALERYLGIDFDHAAQMAADLWDADETDREFVWAARYADTHDVEVYPDTRSLAPAEVREADARAFPHDEACPRCGRRQWGLGPDVTDPMNPTDAEQETCGNCSYSFQGDLPRA